MPQSQLIPRRSLGPRLAPSGAMRAALADALLRVPPRPILFDACTNLLANPNGLRSSDALSLRAFVKLRQALLDGAPRSQELQLLWRNAVATGHYAARIAAALQLDARLAALAGLLHRAGDMRAIVALTRAEICCTEGLDPSARAGVCAEHGEDQSAKLYRSWNIAPRTVEVAVAWRTVDRIDGKRDECFAVYCAHLLSIRHSAPEFAPPGLAEAAEADIGLGAETLNTARADDAALELLLQKIA